MPSADRYSKYRADQTTVWISKNAREFLDRERAGGEGTASVLDRLIAEMRKHRRLNPSLAGEGRPAAKVASKTASKATAKTASKAAGKTARKAGAKTAGSKMAGTKSARTKTARTKTSATTKTTRGLAAGPRATKSVSKRASKRAATGAE